MAGTRNAKSGRSATSGRVASSGRVAMASRITSPLDLPNLAYWFRADLGVSTTGGKVTNWLDQSGNGHHVSQSTDSQRPTFNASDANFNNQSTFTFANASSTQLDNTTTNPIAQSSARTLFACFRGTDVFNGGTLIDFKRGSPEFVFSWYAPDGNLYLFSDAVSTNIAISPETQIPGRQGTTIVLTHICPATGAGIVTARINGSATPYGKVLTYLAGGNVPAEGSGTGFAIGRRPSFGQGLIGQLAELFGCTGVLNEGQMRAAELYLLQRYGVGGVAP